MQEKFEQGSATVVVDNLIVAIQTNKQFLSDIDGAIGDGQVDVLQRIHRAVLHLEGLGKVFDLDHDLLLSW